MASLPETVGIILEWSPALENEIGKLLRVWSAPTASVTTHASWEE